MSNPNDQDQVYWKAAHPHMPRPPAAANNEGFKGPPEGLATGIGAPDKALVTETVLPVGKLGQLLDGRFYP